MRSHFKDIYKTNKLDYSALNLSCSNELSKSSNSCSKQNSKFIESTRSLGALQLTHASFGYFLFIKINFSSLSNYNQHLLKLLRIPSREKHFSTSI